MPTLNRRHKIALFLTLLIAGLSLVGGASLRISLGISLLGIALAWGIGSDRKAAHLVIDRWIKVTSLATPSLNRRRRIALFLTLVIVGLSLVGGASLRMSLGISLLGTALAWSIGSNSRAVHFVFLCFGCLLLMGSAIVYWRNSASQEAMYRRKVSEYKKRVVELRQSIPRLAQLYPLEEKEPPFSILGPLEIDRRVKADAYQAFFNAGDPSVFDARFSSIDIPTEAKTALKRARFSLSHSALFMAIPSPVPRWAAEALAGGVDIVTLHTGPEDEVEPILGQILPGDKPHMSRRSLSDRVDDVAPLLLPGIVLTLIGIGLIRGVKAESSPAS